MPEIYFSPWRNIHESSDRRIGNTVNKEKTVKMENGRDNEFYSQHIRETVRQKIQNFAQWGGFFLTYFFIDILSKTK